MACAQVIGAQPPKDGLEGYASTTSAPTGSKVDLMVSTTDSSFHVEVYRMGYYGGQGGRLITKSPSLPGTVQTKQVFFSSTGTVSCEWTPSWTANLKGWPPGFYLLKLVSASGWAQWVPLCVRDDASKAQWTETGASSWARAAAIAESLSPSTASRAPSAR